MRKAALMVFLAVAITATAAAKEKPTVLDDDGTLVVSNRDSGGKPFATKRIIIKNETGNYGATNAIRLLVYGTNEDGSSGTIFEARTYRRNDMYAGADNYIEYRHGDSYGTEEPSYDLSGLTRIMLTTTNGTVTNAAVQVKGGSLCITIKGYDFSRLPRLVSEAADKARAQKQERERQEQERIAAIKRNAFERGKALYVQQVLAGQSAENPVLVDSCRIEMDSASGVDVYITLYNNSGKTLKYVDFEVTPYNRVDDVARSAIDGSSTKTIQVVDYIEPMQTYKAHFPPVWYNNTISYITINSIKATFKDGSTSTVPQGRIQAALKKPGLSFQLQNFGEGISLSLNYDIPENRLYIRSDERRGAGSLTRHEVDFVFETGARTVTLGYPRARANSDYSITREYLLDDALLAGAVSGYMTAHDGLPMTPRISGQEESGLAASDKAKVPFTEEELRHIRDFVCIWYYAANKDKGIDAALADEQRQRDMVESAKSPAPAAVRLPDGEEAVQLLEKWGF